jgi:hypothetical protein
MVLRRAGSFLAGRRLQGVIPEMGIICKTSVPLSTGNMNFFLSQAKKYKEGRNAGFWAMNEAGLLRDFQTVPCGTEGRS